MSKNNSSFGIDNVLKIITEDGGRVHFLGVGGVSMASLYCLSRHFGIKCSGSDSASGEYVRLLLLADEDVFVGERESLPQDTCLLVYTLAIDENNSELLYAQRHGIPTVSRAEYMAALMSCYGERIGVSGTHGKSTVTAMLASIFEMGGKNPTVLSGARLKTGAPLLIGGLDYMIFEACEYKDSFLHFSPTLSVFLNLEYDHADYFENIEALESSFLSAIKKCSVAVINFDDPRLSRLARESGKPYVSFSRCEGCDYSYREEALTDTLMRIELSHRGVMLGEILLPMRGAFNAENAVAAATAALTLGISFSDVREALSSFRGIPRRLERVGNFLGREVYYDYAHHPSEIREGIRAIRGNVGKCVTVIFGPHTYSRTKALWNDFIGALSEADYVVLTEIYAARERVDPDVSVEALADLVGGGVSRNREEILRSIKDTKGDIIIMGAADMNWVLEALFPETKNP